MRRSSTLLFLVLLAVPNAALAWGQHGHALASQAATWEVPTELPSFFHRAYGDLVWFGYDPDRWRGAGPSADDATTPDHFLDWEYVAHLDLPPRRHDFIDLLHLSGTIARTGIRTDTSGFVPWRIAEVSELLTEQWKLWRRTEQEDDRKRIESAIVFFAGILGHYVADSANPHHATIHYNGWLGSPARGFRNDCGTHARFESIFVTNHVDLPDVVARLRPPSLRVDYFATALDLIRESNTQVEILYQLDAEGAFDEPPAAPGGTPFAAERLAIGASVLRDLWWSAWVRSGDSGRGERGEGRESGEN